MIPDSHREFPPGASWPPDGVSRRDFLRLAGASAVLAGAAGCGRPAKSLVPWVRAPASVAADERRVYASAASWDGFGRGIVVTTRDGRPVKIEGNPAHAESGGATDAITQAGIRDLYDPARAGACEGPGGLTSWADFEQWWGEFRPEVARRRGRGLALLTEPTTSPTVLRLIGQWRQAYPEGRWYQHTALGRWDHDGRQWDHRLEAAEVIFALGSDFLDRHPAALRYNRAFAGRRGASSRPNRLYVAETSWTLTGGMADVRLAIAPSRIPALLQTVGAGGTAAGGGPLSRTEGEFAALLARDLSRVGAAGVVLAGPENGAPLSVWAEATNRRLGSFGTVLSEGPAVRSDAAPGSAGGARELADALHAGQIDCVCVLGADPVGTTGSKLGFAEALKRARVSIALGGHTATTEACHWRLPESHFLESWGDLRGFDGSLVLQQPLIESVKNTRSLSEVLQLMTTGAAEAGYALVRKTHPVDDGVWNRWLGTGVGEAG